jgi:hypothetical protein
MKSTFRILLLLPAILSEIIGMLSIMFSHNCYKISKKEFQPNTSSLRQESQKLKKVVEIFERFFLDLYSVMRDTAVDSARHIINTQEPINKKAEEAINGRIEGFKDVYFSEISRILDIAGLSGTRVKKIEPELKAVISDLILDSLEIERYVLEENIKQRIVEMIGSSSKYPKDTVG